MVTRPRSAGLIDHDLAGQCAVLIIGCGAIGSNLVEYLVRMGIGIINVFDGDIVNPENIEPQAFVPEDVDLPKPRAIKMYADIIDPDVAVIPHETVWRSDRHSFGGMFDVVISGVDSMETRIDIARALLPGEFVHYIDARMGANVVEIFHVTPNNVEDYVALLASAKPMSVPCSMKAIAYNGRVAAGLVARQVAAILNYEPVPDYLKLDLLAWSLQTSDLVL